MAKQKKTGYAEGLRLNNEPTAGKFFMSKQLNVLYWAIAAFAILFRIYKAHNAGIIFDEVWTYEEFCTNLHTAVTQYHLNNHLLNSIFIIIAQKLFGGYDHFLRIPSLIFGVAFCFFVAVILKKALISNFLRIAAAALILMNWFILDLTYLARGYAISLGAVFCGISILLNICDKKSHSAYHWQIVVGLIIVNFVSIGAMLSSLPVVLSVNLIYAGVLLADAFQAKKEKLLGAVTMIITVMLGSGALLFLLYYKSLSQIRYFSNIFSIREPFGNYMNQVLYNPLILPDLADIDLKFFLSKVFLTVLIACCIICIIRFIWFLRFKKSLLMLLRNPAFILVLIFLLTLVFMWVQRVIFNVPLGMPRNGVFLFVLMLLSSAAVIDRSIDLLISVPAFSRLACLICVLVISALSLFNWPSYNAVQVHPRGWAIESSIGPLARTLKKIDANKKWRIRLEGYTEDAWRPIQYYQQRGYNIELVNDGSFEIAIIPESNPSNKLVYIDYSRFIQHRCCMVVNSNSFGDWPVFYQVLPTYFVEP